MDPSPLCRLTTPQLCNIYHTAEVYCVGYMVAPTPNAVHMSLYYLDLAIACRKVVMERYNDADSGHALWLQLLIDEKHNMLNYAFGLGKYRDSQNFQFSCHGLVRDARNAGVHVPRQFT